MRIQPAENTVFITKAKRQWWRYGKASDGASDGARKLYVFLAASSEIETAVWFFQLSTHDVGVKQKRKAEALMKYDLRRGNESRLS